MLPCPPPVNFLTVDAFCSREPRAERLAPLRVIPYPRKRGRGANHVTDEATGKDGARKQREARLAAQLRENLKKRKAQARARGAAGVKPKAEQG